MKKIIERERIKNNYAVKVESFMPAVKHYTLNSYYYMYM